MAKRIRLLRTRGYSLPENAVHVARPSRWGNPLKLVDGKIFINTAHGSRHRSWEYVCDGTIEQVLDLYRIFVTGKIERLNIQFKGNLFGEFIVWANHFRHLDINELKGKDLACFCRPDQKCHADILLELANK